MSALYRQFTTQADLDAAYDVEKSVPDFTVYARQYVESSEQVRRQLDCELDVKFGPTIEEYADIFPASRRNAPVLIFIHGGYWRILSAKDFSFTALGPAAADITVVVANYALCPKVTIYEISRQMRALVAWVYNTIALFNGDSENIFICGHSAGGHLAAMCSLTDWQQDYGLPRTVVRGAIPISGLFDLEPIQLTFLQTDLRITDRDVHESSPQRLIQRCPTAMLLSYGSEELSEFARHSDEFVEVWKKVGNRVRFFAQPGRNHFTAITDLADVASPLSKAIFDFMGHRHRERKKSTRFVMPLSSRRTGLRR